VSERIKALADLADTPLFFGRLDYLHPGVRAPLGVAGRAPGSWPGWARRFTPLPHSARRSWTPFLR
ncbi:hypothetical protein AB0L49_33355, partial [Streptomyces antimycoticus]|uniref:hypothetical protein n=1 Tax=Streptomyces antimycoticus TaxID=68175 RepID=UPI003412F94A